MDPDAPLHRALNDCAVRLDELNTDYPHLATETSLSGVALWQAMLRAGPGELLRGEPVDELGQTRELALGLMRHNGLEEVLEILLDEHRIDLSMDDLVLLIGTSAYVEALRSDGRKLVANAISYEQIATLWNDLERPALSGSRWNAKSVSSLLG
ncbi:MAG TPA: hypothetical protein ENK50_05935 [Sedimenticola sp.]|nr:hypothetical protein [Sedimenticola sp.]